MIKIKLTPSQKNAVDWALDGMDTWDKDNEFRDDNGIPKDHELKIPYIKGNYLYLDNSESYFMDLMFDLKYRLCEQIPDGFESDDTAKSRGMINAAQNVWNKIEKEIN